MVSDFKVVKHTSKPTLMPVVGLLLILIGSASILFFSQVPKVDGYVAARERDALVLKNTLLERELSSVSKSSSRALAYEKQLKANLQKLRGAITTIANLQGVVAPSSFGGIGGGEIVCRSNSCQHEDGDAILDLIEEDISEKNGDELLAAVEMYADIITSAPIIVPVTDGAMTSGFGSRVSPFSKKRVKHQGMDIAAPTGTAVNVTATGRVLAVRRHPSYGLVVEVEHNERLTTLYAHLSSAAVKEGDKVERGMLIGHVGSSGRTTGPHLHYEIRVDGAPKDPERFIEVAKIVNPELIRVMQLM